MTAKILNGKELAQQIQTQLRNDIQLLQRKPSLAVILVGNDAASKIYVSKKQEACKEVGIKSIIHDLPENTSEEALIKLIEQLNKDANIDGILVQLPLPSSIKTQTIIERIHPNKDVDGFHPYNLGLLAQGKPYFRSCTPYGIMRLLETTQIDLCGMNAVVVGASNIVGKPMALELLLAGCTVTICHSKTKDLSQHIKQADILISATGKLNIIESAWIKEGAIVIDVGIHRNEKEQIIGDIDFDTACKKASWITPVPGGVGPMTVAMLLSNTLLAAIMK